MHPVGDNHKVIFAGNPISYGDERRMASLFECHGNAVLFEPLSKAVLFEKVLTPIFDGLDIFMPSITPYFGCLSNPLRNL